MASEYYKEPGLIFYFTESAEKLMTTMKNSEILKEKAIHGTSSFPFGFYEVFESEPWEGIKHHWHEEIEILYMMKGAGKIEINMNSLPIDQEGFFFINAGELHALTPDGPCHESAVLFRPDILCFDTYDLAQNHLLQPLLKGDISLPKYLSSSSPVFENIKKEYLEIASIYYRSGASLSENIPAQLFIKAGLLKILAYLSSCQLLESSKGVDSYKVEILKTSIAYIREHYHEKIYIRDLAGLANMNEQYFCRFFKDAIGKSPIAYLNDYRIRRALTLLQDTNLPVMDICLNCGFNNFGNFLKEFKKHTGTTPTQYRKSSHS